ncbi:hypothetical protein KJ903_05695 [Patescibacteria group bacterium]|nr:hypothetical protein [Patescibacteria group bacterium]
MTETQINPSSSQPQKKGGKACLIILIIGMGLFFSAVLVVAGWYGWQQLESAKDARGNLESSFNNLKTEINKLQDRTSDLEKAEEARKKKEVEDAKVKSETEKTTSGESTDVASQCEFSKTVSLKEATTYDIFGTDIFDTVVCGYLETKEEEVWDVKQTNAYFAIKKFYHDGFKQSIEKGITEGNSVNNKKNDGTYLFNLGCYQDGKVSGRDYEEGVSYIDAAAQNALQDSSADKPVSIILSFGQHGGTGCSCCNLAHKIRAY